eukprot:SAG31_NODE_12885_length_909_cov_1.025926_1_plen_45_part_01
MCFVEVSGDALDGRPDGAAAATTGDGSYACATRGPTRLSCPSGRA